jgi:hypothetical protein
MQILIFSEVYIVFLLDCLFKKNMKLHIKCFALTLVLFYLGCEYTPDMNRIDEIAKEYTNNIGVGDTSYIEILPPIGGPSSFKSPQALLIGKDQLLYIADYEANELIMMDIGGNILSRKTVPHPVSIAQNTKLDLYVGGETISTNGDTIGAIYKIFMVRFDTTYYDTLKSSLGVDSIVPRPSSTPNNHNLDSAHMNIVWREPSRPTRRYTGIGILPTNEFLVARTGPNNGNIIDPDTRILFFNKGDTMIAPIPDLITRPSGGNFITDIRFLTGLMVFPRSRDIIITQSSDGVAYGAIWMIYKKQADFEGWLPKFDPSVPGVRPDIIKQYQFNYAAGVTYDSRRREIFVVDSGLDSVLKFDINGNFRTESFGRNKTRTAQFPGLLHPKGIAFSNDCTLFVADTGNKFIRRFRLSNQTRCY